jgi:hypothetical protein
MLEVGGDELLATGCGLELGRLETGNWQLTRAYTPVRAHRAAASSAPSSLG